MDYKSSLVLLLIVLSSISSFSDGLEEGVVIDVLSGDTFTYLGYTGKKIKKYKLVCVKAESVRTKRGKYQKKILESHIKGKKNIEGILRGELKDGTILIEVIDSEREKMSKTGPPKMLNYRLVRDKVLKKIREYPECWLGQKI